MRIAMWSGPRNLSTAMMYSFGTRSDCALWDEPFYAAYLRHSDAVHPTQDAVIAAGIADPAKVAAQCATGPVPHGKPVFYLLPAFPRDWMASLTNVFLIRHPARFIASYHARRKTRPARHRRGGTDAIVRRGRGPDRPNASRDRQRRYP